jgi:hypothetical protein
MASTLTGAYPNRHGLRNPFCFVNFETVTEYFKKRGYETAAFLGIDFLNAARKFNKGFSIFKEPTDEKEWQEELDRVTVKTKEVLAQTPDVLISVYTLLDRIQHFHWGEECVVDWYQKLDARLGELLLDTGFLSNEANKLIVISDHGFCSFGEAKIQTLLKETEQGTLKGDHHENALLITVKLDYPTNSPQDVFHAILKSP